jgi:hypothetical protein
VAETRLSKILAIIGLVAIVLGVAISLIPTTVEVWTPRKATLVKKVVTVYPRQSDYILALAPFIPKESRSLMINGTVKELKGYTFDFYIFNEFNYELWKAGASYEAYFQRKEVSSCSFSFSLRREDTTEGLRFVAVNKYAKVAAQKQWFDQVLSIYEFMDYNLLPFIYPYVDTEQLPISVRGRAEEMAGRRFNLIVLDGKNYDLWRVGQPYSAIYEARGVTDLSFSFFLTPEKVEGLIYFIAERVEPNVRLNVKVSADMSYEKPVDISVENDAIITWEEKSYAHVLGGLALGTGLFLLGLVLLFVAVVLKLVFER